MLDEGLLAGAVAVVLPVQLRDGHVGLVDDQQVVLGEEVEQSVRGLARGAPVDVTAVVFDPGAAAHLGQHFQVVSGPHAQALGFEQLAVFLELVEPLLQLDLDAVDGTSHPLRPGDVVGGRENDDLVDARPEPRPSRGRRAMIRSISSPKSSTRKMCSSYAGWTSMVSPRTRNLPRTRLASLRSYCMSTSRPRMARWSYSWPTARARICWAYSSGEPRP